MEAPISGAGATVCGEPGQESWVSSLSTCTSAVVLVFLQGIWKSELSHTNLKQEMSELCKRS